MTLGYDMVRFTRMNVTLIAIFNHQWWILFYLHMNGFSITILGNTNLENEAHKILHTFEKMDAINPTFEREEYRIKLREKEISTT
jgi:hypothetical protein